MNPPTDDEMEERRHRDESPSSNHSTRRYGGIALVLLTLIGAITFGVSPVVGADATSSALYSGDAGPSPAFATNTDPIARCTVSATSVQVGESVTIDASGSENADDHQYDKYGNEAFGEYTTQRSRLVSYAEPGTYDPQVKVWSYSDGEASDVAACGSITVTEATSTPTPTPTATPTPAPSAVAKCTLSETSVQVGESVTIDASGSEHADDYQYDKYGGSSFGEYTAQRSRLISYSEPGTYEPRVKVWSYSGSETSDIAACGTITVTEATSTPTPTPTATPTPAPSAVAKCTLSETSVQVGESVTIDASGSEHADDYQYDKYGGSSFGEYTAQRSRLISYSEPGTYEPRVKVWSYSGSETSDIAACGTITVTEATPTVTATPMSTATPTSTDSEASAPSTRATTPVPTAAATQTSSSSTGTATDGEAWFGVSPSDPNAGDMVRLVAYPAVAQDTVATHRWDIDGDGTVDQRGRVLELPARTDGETTVTLTIERTNGSTASVTRAVPISPNFAGETVTPQRPAVGTGGIIPAAVGLVLLLVLVAAVAGWSRRDR